MMHFRYFLLTVLLACTTRAIQITPSYVPPPQRLPHREYGVPQQMPFREYGPPSLKYGSPKLYFIGGGSASSGLHEQIKNYYGAPKPFYGPPYKPQQQYGLPLTLFSTYGPPSQKLQHKPTTSYGHLKQYVPPPPQALPLSQPPPQFKPSHQPATSYGPPPSGPLIIPPHQIYGQPPKNYGPPPLPAFGNGPKTTIIVTGDQDSQKQQQQTEIQIDTSGHTHSVVGSQEPIHTACDGWKPIPAPTGAYIENNYIETQSGYSHVQQAQAHRTKYNGGTSAGVGAIDVGSTTLVSGPDAGVKSIVDELTNEQLVAVALQSSTFDADNVVLQQNVLPSPEPVGDFNQHRLNSIDSETFKLSVVPIDDTYSKPSADYYAPGSKNSYTFNHNSYTHNSQSGFGITGPGGKFGFPPPNGRYGPPPLPNINYGPPSIPPKGNYGHPPLPSGTHDGPLSLPFRLPPQSAHGPAAFVHHHAQAGLGIQYGRQTGNLVPFPPNANIQPSIPVAYKPPVPQGLFEAIGATVQHLDKFGVKPQLQAPTFIPPAANEIAHTGPGNLNIDYGTSQQQSPSNIIEQQLPQQRPAQVFIKIEQQQPNSYQQQQQHTEYGVPPPPQAQQEPPQLQHLPLLPLATPQKPYQQLSTGPQQEHLKGDSFYSSSASANFDSSAFATTQNNNEYTHAQSFPLPHNQPRFHDCGHGPNLIGAGSFNYQQHQQQEQYSSGSSASIAQSIPIAEQHTHFVSGPSTSYGPPPSGASDIDHIGYASDRSQVAALPDGTNPEGLPGLAGLDVISAEKSQAIHFSSQETKSNKNYQVQFGGAGQETANHEEILSADLLQTILNAVEQPQLQHQLLPANHKAESRSDMDINQDPIEAEHDNETDLAIQESKNVEIKVHPNDENLIEISDVQEIIPILVKEGHAVRY